MCDTNIEATTRSDHSICLQGVTSIELGSTMLSAPGSCCGLGRTSESIMCLGNHYFLYKGDLVVDFIHQ